MTDNRRTTATGLEGIGRDDQQRLLTLARRALEARVRRGGLRELILATNPDAEGDATAHYLHERLAPLGVPISRIAYGMPLGGDLEYADHVTVGLSVSHRRSMDG